MCSLLFSSPFLLFEHRANVITNLAFLYTWAVMVDIKKTFSACFPCYTLIHLLLLYIVCCHAVVNDFVRLSNDFCLLGFHSHIKLQLYIHSLFLLLLFFLFHFLTFLSLACVSSSIAFLTFFSFFFFYFLSYSYFMFILQKNFFSLCFTMGACSTLWSCMSFLLFASNHI